MFIISFILSLSQWVLWRSGSAFDSQAVCCGFESRCGQELFFNGNIGEGLLYSPAIFPVGIVENSNRVVAWARIAKNNPATFCLSKAVCYLHAFQVYSVVAGYKR